MMGRKGRGGWGGAALLAVACGGTIDFKTDPGGGGSGGGNAGSMPSAGMGTAGKKSSTPSGGSAGHGGSIGNGGNAGTNVGEDGGEPNVVGSGGTSNVETGTLRVLKSTGCGKPLPAEQVPTIPGSRTGYTEFSVNLSGATLGTDVPENALPRQFFVRVPADYDPNRPYRVVYIGSGCGALHAGKTNTFPLFNETQGGDEQAVYVGMSVPDGAVNPGCYDNNTGAQSQEWEAFDLMHTFVEKTYCVDNNQIYVAGYSSGAWLANMWGCYFGGTPSPPLDVADVSAGRDERKFAPHWAIRGHLASTGSLPPNQPQPCNGPAAGFWLHDVSDKSNLIATNIAALNLALQTNGCAGNYEDGPKAPWAPGEQIPGLEGGQCQQYTGCPAAVNQKYPLVFCTTNGFGHADQSVKAIPAFTQFMNQIAPTQ